MSFIDNLLAWFLPTPHSEPDPAVTLVLTDTLATDIMEQHVETRIITLPRFFELLGLAEQLDVSDVNVTDAAKVFMQLPFTNVSDMYQKMWDLQRDGRLNIAAMRQMSNNNKQHTSLYSFLEIDKHLNMQDALDSLITQSYAYWQSQVDLDRMITSEHQQALFAIAVAISGVTTIKINY